MQEGADVPRFRLEFPLEIRNDVAALAKSVDENRQANVIWLLRRPSCHHLLTNDLRPQPPHFPLHRQDVGPAFLLCPHRFGLVEVPVEADLVANLHGLRDVPRIGSVGEHDAPQKPLDPASSRSRIRSVSRSPESGPYSTTRHRVPPYRSRSPGRRRCPSCGPL